MSEVAQPMPGRLAEIENSLDRRALADRCDKKGCVVSLDGIGAEFLLVDLDADGSPIASTEGRCDYLFFTERETMLHVTVLELKSGGFKHSEVERQLQAGASAVERLCHREAKKQFQAVLVHGVLKKAARRWLREMHVIYEGTPYAVHRKSCGTPMAEILTLSATA